jgi:hypothetical protein
MQKAYFHNSKLFNENKDKKKFTQSSKVETNTVVDINILLNRVKIEEKNEIRRKIILFSFATLALILFGSFIAIIN